MGADDSRRHPILVLLQLLALTLVTALLGLLIWRYSSSQRGANLLKAVSHQKMPAAPGFTLGLIWRNGETWPARLRPALRQSKLALRALRGHPSVINFWASWCGPCKAEAPRLAAAARAHAGTVVFLGVDVDDATSDARHFLRRFRVRYPSVHDDSGITWNNYGLTGVPETYWLDARGRIVAHYAGAISKDQLESGIQEAETR